MSCDTLAPEVPFGECGIRTATQLAHPRHQVHELVEEVLRVVRPGRRLGMVLHREGASVNEFDPFDHPVVGAGVAHLCGAERSVEPLTRFTFQREAVVLSGDGDPTGGVIDDRAR